MNPTERIEIDRPAALPGVEVLRAVGCSRAWSVYHERYVFVTGAAGASEWRYRGRDYLQEPRGVMLIEPGELHRDTRVLHPTTFTVLFVEAAVLEAATTAPAVPHPRHAQTSDPALWRVLTGLQHAVARGAPALEQQSRLAEVLGRVLTAHAEHSARSGLPDRPAAVRARDYLHAHWAEDVTLDALSTVAAQSKYHLVRSFRDAFGLPPHAYQVRLRLEKARGLLAVGMPITRVALEAGFADQSHFTRYFRQAWGITPGRYAAAR